MTALYQRFIRWLAAQTEDAMVAKGMEIVDRPLLTEVIRATGFSKPEWLASEIMDGLREARESDR